MKKFALSVLLLSSAAFAEQEFHLNCKAVLNSDTIMATEVKIAHKQRNVSIGGDDQFEFILSSNGESVIELQAYDRYGEPSRSYATATMTGQGSFVELSIWRRAYLLEARCTRLN